MKILAKTGPKGDPMAVPSIWPSGLDMLMTLLSYFTIRTPLFNSFLISIADTTTFNIQRFLPLMSSSNATLTTTFQLLFTVKVLGKRNNFNNGLLRNKKQQRGNTKTKRNKDG